MTLETEAENGKGLKCLEGEREERVEEEVRGSEGK